MSLYYRILVIFWGMFCLAYLIGAAEKGYSRSNSGGIVVKISLINPTQYGAPESYLSPRANILTDSLVLGLNDTLANLPGFIDREAPVLETTCFYPDIKLVYKNYTYIVSTHCASIFKFKNDRPFTPTTKRLANDFMFTESLIGYFIRLKKNKLGNDNSRFFSSLKENSALNIYKGIPSNNSKNLISNKSKVEKKAIIPPAKTEEKEVASKPIASAELKVKSQPKINQNSTSSNKDHSNNNQNGTDNEDIPPAPEKVGITRDDYEQKFNYPALIRTVTLLREDGDSALYVDKTDMSKPVFFTKQNIANHPMLKAADQTIQFTFAAPSNGKPIYFQYCWKLEGVDKNWNEWTNKNIAEYTQIPQGELKFLVKARNNFGKISNQAEFGFIVVPEWHKNMPEPVEFVSQIRRVLIKRSGYDSVVYRGANTQQLQNGIVLDNDCNDLRFEFAKLENNAGKPYQFFIENIDENWRDWTSKEYVDLNDLPFGDYVFHLRTKDGEGGYSKETVIPFVIERAWHESWAFYGGTIASFLMLAIASAWNERKKTLEHKWVAALIFLGLMGISEIVFYNLQHPTAIDSFSLGMSKIALYGTLAVLLSWLPLEKLFEKLDPKFRKREAITKSTGTKSV